MDARANKKLRKRLKRAQRQTAWVYAFALTAAVVALSVALMLMKGGSALTRSEKVLDCPVTGVVAHTHNADCYDADGNLVCPLPERALHVHDDSCYTETRTLACGLEEHVHTDACYDANGELICGLEEHEHSEACYEVERELTCGKEEVATEHVHGPGCFRTVETTVDADAGAVADASSDAPADESRPAQTFTHRFVDADDQLVLQVDVDAPEGALPAGATLVATWIDPAALTTGEQDVLAREVAAQTKGDELQELQAVDISFVDAQGNEVEPAKKVTVTLTSSLADAADDEGHPVVVHIDDLTKEQAQSVAEGGAEPERTAQVLDVLSERELDQHELALADDQLAFEADQFSTYVLGRAKAPAADGADATDGDPEPAADEEPVTVGLYGYNFGGLYKRYSNQRYAIGYAADLGNLANNFSFTSATPFTYGSEGFNVESEGLWQEETNTYAGYKYEVIGFVPVTGSSIESLSIADYYNGYVRASREDAMAAVTSANGVLYGQTPTAEAVTALTEGGSMAVVWLQRDPMGFKSANLSASPTKVAPGEDKEVTLRPGLSGLQKGDYSESPLKVALTLDDNLTFSDGWTPSIADNSYYTVDPASVTVSEDRKTLSFNITEVKKDYSSYAYLPINAQLDVADGQQTSDVVNLSVTNAWDEEKTARTTLTIDRPTVSTMLDNKAEKALFFGDTDQSVQLKVEHGNATSGATDAHVRIAFPSLVTVKSATVAAACKDAIDPESIKITTDPDTGISTLEYDVTRFTASSSKATDLIDLVLGVREKADQDEETGATACMVTVNDKQALVTRNASIKVSDPYFEVILYGPQDAWLDMSRGDGSAWSTSRTLRFYGASDSTALSMYKWSFDEDPIAGIYSTDADGSIMIGPVVNNQYTNMQWTLVGFVPISYWSGTIRDRWNPLYGVYYLDDREACEQLIQERGGVLYGETPTEEQARSLAQYRSGESAKVVCVWYIQEPPKEVYQKYEYDDPIVPAVHPAAYTTTSSGIEVAIESAPAHSGSGVHPYNVTFTIPEDCDEDVITLNTEFNEALKAKVSGFQPGDKLQYHITVIDKSGRYGYLKDSGAVGTIDYYTAEGMDYSVIGTGFEGYKIENSDEKPGGHSAKSRITRRGDSYAIRKLAEISEMKLSQNPTDENVGKMLYAIGYGAVTDDEGKPTGPLRAYDAGDGTPDYIKITQDLLDDYFLDFLNAAYFAQDAHKGEDKSQPHFTNFADLSADEYRSIFNGDTGTQVMETNPVLASAMYYGMYEESILMSESETGIENYQGTYTWMHDWNETTEGNAYEQVIYNQYEENQGKQADGSVVHNLSWYQWVTGTRNGNHMQDTYFGLAYQFKLVKRIKITKVELGHTDADHTLTGAKFTLTMVDAQGHKTDEQPLGLPATIEVDENGEALLPTLLPGRYKLEETKAPAAHVLAEEPWYFTLDATGEAHFEEGSKLVSQVEGRFNEFWIENTPGQELPSTGGVGTTPLTVTGVLMVLAGMGWLVRRRCVDAQA